MNHRHSSPRGFTLVEILVTITLIAILSAVMVPVIRGMMSRSHSVRCSNQLRQIGAACLLYASDNNNTLPVTTHQRRQGIKSWTITLEPYTSETLAFHCTKDEHPTREISYVINDFLTPNPVGAPDLNLSRLANVSRPESSVLFAEVSPSYLNTDHFHFSVYRGGRIPAAAFAKQVAVERHDGSANYLFVDGHVETLSWKEVQRRLSNKSLPFIDPTASATTTNP